MSVSCSDISVLLFSQAQKLREKREAIDKAEKLKKKKQKKLAAWAGHSGTAGMSVSVNGYLVQMHWLCNMV